MSALAASPSSAPADTIAQEAAAPGYALVTKRNCSITPRAVLILLAITCVVSFAIGAAFAWAGLWLVLPFAGIEMAALAWAFYVNGRHAGDYERFVLDASELVVEIRDAERIESHRFPVSWVRVVARESRRDIRIALALHGRELSIGRHLDAHGRKRIATELGGLLGRAQVATAAAGAGAAGDMTIRNTHENG